MTGRAFSGKSTLARLIAEHKGAVLVSQDELLSKNEDKFKNIDESKRWHQVLKMAEEKIVQLLESGQSVVFDNVNTQRKHRDDLRDLVSHTGAHVVVVYLNTPDEILEQRQNENKITNQRHDVSQRHIDDLKRRFEAPSDDENFFEFTPETDFDKWLNDLD